VTTTLADRVPDATVTAGSGPVPVPHVPGVAVGCDVVDVARIAALLDRRPAARERLFTPAELADSTRDGVAADAPVAVRRLAARFAAKEALVKLLRRPQLAWTDVEVVAAADGAPTVRIHGAPTDIAVSLSHDGAVAMAVVARRTSDHPTPPTRITSRS
jgi:holo-[acyl-carrier protein] synthase